MLQPCTEESKIGRIPIIVYMQESAFRVHSIDNAEILSNLGAIIPQHVLK